MPSRELAIDPAAKPSAGRRPRVTRVAFGNLVVVGGLVLAVVLLAVNRGPDDGAAPSARPPNATASGPPALPIVLSEHGITIPGAIVEPDDERDESGAVIAAWPRVFLAPVSGTLTAWHVTAGDRVVANDTVLASVDAPQVRRERVALTAAVAAVRAEIARRAPPTGVGREAERDSELAALVAEYEAAQTLHDSVSASELTALRALVSWARAMLDQERARHAARSVDDRRAALALRRELAALESRAAAVEAALATRALTVPLAARVLRREARVGQWLVGAQSWVPGAGEPSPLVTLYDPAHMRVSAIVPAAQLANQPGRPRTIHVGRSATIILPTRSTAYAGTVLRVLPETAAAGRGVVVWVAFVQPDARCFPGLTAEVTFRIGPDDDHDLDHEDVEATTATDSEPDSASPTAADNR